jgi:hypothetical protein
MNRQHLARIATLLAAGGVVGWAAAGPVRAALACAALGLTAAVYWDTTRRERARLIERVSALCDKPYTAVYDLAYDVRAEIREAR